MKYKDYLAKEPDYDALEVFFAFNNKQLEEGLAKFNPNKDKVFYQYPNGMIATKEGRAKIHEFYNNHIKEVSANCTPQEVYDYEYANYECDYADGDEDAIR